MELKQKLALLMSRKNLNNQKLARLSQVSDSEVSRILQGKSRPGLDNALRLAQAVGVSLDYLADDRLDSEPVPPEEAVSDGDRKLLALCEKIGTHQALAILENVRFLGYEVAMARLVGARPVIETGDKDGSSHSMSGDGRGSIHPVSTAHLVRTPGAPSNTTSATA